MTKEKPDLARSWEANAERWTDAVRSGAIASRRLATDAAIMDAITARQPRRVLDLGCGEGWLARALTARGIEAVGIDASPALIEAARAAGPEHYQVASYADLIARPELAGDGFGVVVANFALLDEVLAAPLNAVRSLLVPEGAVIIQTLHPFAAAPPYQDGWRVETFNGFAQASAGGEWHPMPWYFRTLGSWIGLLRQSGYALADLRETVRGETYHPLSMIIITEPA